jgi:2-polyprenyl-6-methoxyphenol hydroxylase-like FAD-dependent oxidoreductase
MKVAPGAVVVGAGVGGLLAALVLRGFYDHVTVLERDSLASTTEARGGVPQGPHIHALLARGTQVLDILLPGMREALAADGVPTGDVLADARWYYNGYRLRRSRADLAGLAITRPHLEYEIRRRVAALSGVEFRTSCRASGLALSPDSRAVCGVRVRHAGSSSPEVTLPAGLVVDASGRGSHTSRWLAENGYPPPKAERVRVDLGYSTCWFDMPEDVLGNDTGIVVGATPARCRGGGMCRTADGRWLVSLFGYAGNHPPVTDDGFVAFAAELLTSEIYDALCKASPLGAVVQYRFPYAVRRRYERLSRFPEGLVVIGDAACSFNPIYAQGMSVAADQALILREHLRLGTGSVHGFRRAAARASRTAWNMSVAGDLRIPEVDGPRTARVRLANAYTDHICRAAREDPAVARAFVRVANLVDPPGRLLRPGMVARVLAGGLRRDDLGKGSEGHGDGDVQ